jgi:hypothetical protein
METSKYVSISDILHTVYVYSVMMSSSGLYQNIVLSLSVWNSIVVILIDSPTQNF